MQIVSAAYDQWGNVIVVYEGHPPDAVITVPADPGNSDYQELLAWEAEGNAITPYKAAVLADHSNYDAMLERRQNAALDAGDTDAAFKILLQRQG
jgi:hypothetical protein